MTDSVTPDAVRSKGAAGDETRIHQLRQDVVAGFSNGEGFAAMQAARLLLALAPGRRSYRFLRDTIASIDPERAALKPLKIALLASFSIEFLHDALVALALGAGYRLEIYQPAFATFRQEILNARSGLFAEAPDVVVLAVEASDWSTAPFDDFFSTVDTGIDAAVAKFRAEISALVETFRSRSTAPLLLHNLALPAWRKLGLFDAKSATGQSLLLQRMNDEIVAVARHTPGTHVVDYAGLVNRLGALNWYDERMRLYARAPIASAAQAHLAHEYVKYLRALTGGAKKCLVVDLDNTLWGGIVGEDGTDGIRIGATYPGSAFAEFQRHLLDLQRRGVLLAVASKNNPADVDEVFERHRDMVLRRADFAALEIGWAPKSESLRRIANQLSIGLEHVVFVDDNPAECEEVRRALPQVHVVTLPAQPERYVETLQREGLFDTLSLSDEDRRRSELYRQRGEAENLRTRVGSLEDYYRDLAMQIDVAPIASATLPRASQLTQKTNQFNVTTRRYSEAELAQQLADPSWIGFTVAVRDRFGDNGIVGVALAREAQQMLEVDSLLMSCRVIGRSVETAILAHLCDVATSRKLEVLRGRVVPTTKNLPARDLFERHGFSLEREDERGESSWRLDLGQGRVEWPAWFARQSHSSRQA